jgi:hypothetical protein
MQKFNPPRQITTQPVLPDAEGYTWIFDSTDSRAWDQPQYAKTASVPTAGPVRSGAINLRATLTVVATTENVTVVIYSLDGAGTWRLNTTESVTAGSVPTEIEWDNLAADCLIGILAGASAPSALATTLYFTERW